MITYIALPLGDTQVLMGSYPPGNMGPATVGDNVAVSVSLDSAHEARRVFDGLSAGGTVTMPFDRFGVNWMVDCSLPQAG